MYANNSSEAERLILSGHSEIMFQIDLDLLTKLQLYLTGRASKGVELYGIGGVELRGFAFMYHYKNLINSAVDRGYKVFVIKLMGSSGGWHLKFSLKMFITAPLGNEWMNG